MLFDENPLPNAATRVFKNGRFRFRSLGTHFDWEDFRFHPDGDVTDLNGQPIAFPMSWAMSHDPSRVGQVTYRRSSPHQTILEVLPTTGDRFVFTYYRGCWYHQIDSCDPGAPVLIDNDKNYSPAWSCLGEHEHVFWNFFGISGQSLEGLASFQPKPDHSFIFPYTIAFIKALLMTALAFPVLVIIPAAVIKHYFFST